MCMNNNDLIEKMVKTRKLKPNTARRYRLILNRYSEFNNMTLEELLEEADIEEEQRIRQKKRKIKQRLIDFRTYAYDNYMTSTAKSHIDIVLTFYRHHEIEIPILPKVSQKNKRENPPLKFSDLLTKDIIKKVLDKANPLLKAVVLFSISSGCANAETMSLSIQDFIDATSNSCSPYHNTNNIHTVIDELIDRDDIVPTFYMKRRKTNKYYYTFCTPEASHAILAYLGNARRKLVPEDKLFRIHPNALARKLAEINDELGLGKKGTYNRLRTHMFRKFHASSLKKDGMSMDDINSIQGKGKSLVNQPYFFDSPDQLRETYMEHMSAVTIEWNIRNLDMKSREYHLLEQELIQRNQDYDVLKNRVSSIEEILSDNGSYEDLKILKKYM